MGRLADGTVLPAFLEAVDTSGITPGAENALRDFQLRVGEVLKAYAPTDEENASGVMWEYIVQVNGYRDDQSLSEAPQMYRATLADLFGNLADRCRYTLRPASREPAPGRSVANGSIVLVLCASGDKSQAFIIGAWRQPLEQEPENKAKFTDPSETFFDFEFNGAKVHIDKDGAVTITVPGATKLDGTPADDRDENNHGSTLSLGKDGTVTVSDANGDAIVISPKDKTITTTAGTATTSVEKKWTLKTKVVLIEADEVSVKAGKVNLGDEELGINPLDEVVVGSGIDAFTGIPYKVLGNTSAVVKAKKQ